MLNLAEMNFVNSSTNIIIISGPTGSGKTYLASVLGIEACKRTLRTYYIRKQNIFKRIDELSTKPIQLKYCKKIV